MSAVAWFFASAVLFAVGAYVAIFTVTTRNAMHGWVALGFTIGVFVALALALMSTS